MKFTDDLQRKKLGMKVDVFIGPFFPGIYLFVSISLWDFQGMLGSKCDTSTNVCIFMICFVHCV